MNFYTQINEIGGNKLITYFEKIRTVVDEVDGFAPQGGLINTPELLNRQSIPANGFLPCFLFFEARFSSRLLSAILTTVLLLLQRTSLFVPCNNSGHTVMNYEFRIYRIECNCLNQDLQDFLIFLMDGKPAPPICLNRDLPAIH